MRNRILALTCAVLSLGVAAWATGKSYTFTIFDPILAGTKELPPGEYQVNVESDKAVIHKGKLSAENPVKLETGDVKYMATSVVLSKEDGKLHIKEIHLGGTKTRVVFTEAMP